MALDGAGKDPRAGHQFLHPFPAACPAQTYRGEQDKIRCPEIMDGLNFAVDQVLPVCPSPAKRKDCPASCMFLYKMGSLKKLEQLGVLLPLTLHSPSAGCCGMAGDRGFYYPGLTAAATKMSGTK